MSPRKPTTKKAPATATNWPLIPAPRTWLVSLAAAEVDRWRAPIGGGAPANQRRPRLTSGASRRGNLRRRSPRRAARNLTSSLIITPPVICCRYDSAREPMERPKLPIGCRGRAVFERISQFLGKRNVVILFLQVSLLDILRDNEV